MFEIPRGLRHDGVILKRDTKKATVFGMVVGLWRVFLHMFNKRVTVQYPDEKPYLAPRYRGRIILSRDPDGYVLMVEGGRIDHAHHEGNAYRALDETASLSRAVQAAIAATSMNEKPRSQISGPMPVW